MSSKPTVVSWRPFRLESSWYAGVLLVWGVACVDPGGYTADPQDNIVQVSVWPKSAAVGRGQTVRFTAYGLVSSSDSIPAIVTWTATGGVITPDGDFTAGPDTGTFRVTGMHAQRLWLADSAPVAVMLFSPLLQRLAVRPQTPMLALGDSVEFSALGFTAQSDSQAVDATWTAAGGLLVPTGFGRVRYRPTQVGMHQVTATAGPLRDSTVATVIPTPVASVEVAPAAVTVTAGQGVQLQATSRDAAGNALTGRIVTWSTSASAVATVSPTGVVTGQGAGTATITATSEGKAGSATVTVTLVAVASVTVAPGTLSLLVAQTGQLTATPRDAAGNALMGRQMVWTTSASGVATVSSSGLVTGRGAGTATITATSEGQSGTASVSVSLAPVASVSVSPASQSLSVGQSAQLTATLRDAAGNTLSGRAITWSTSAPGVATVDGNGLVTAQGQGTATITATSEGQAGSAAVTVAVGSVASVEVTPSTLSLIAGQVGALTATALDAAGNALPGRPVTWMSTAPAVATVDASGQVTAQGPGSATVRATIEGQVGSAAVAVTGAAVATVSVTPSTLSLTVAQTGQLTATPRDAAGNMLTGRIVAWASSASGVATVNSSGLVTGQGAGSATITATSEGKTGTAAVSVTLAPVATVTVAPASVGLPVGGTRQLTATPRDAAGNVLTGRTVTWTTSAGAVATVNSSGLVTAQALGNATITATSEGKSGTADVTVVELNVAEPVYSASNPDHVLHVYEDWSRHTSISNLGTALRGDGGPPWINEGIKQYGAVVNTPDPFGSVRHVTTDYATDPPIPPHGTAAHAAGFHWFGAGTSDFQGDDNAVGGGKNNRGFILTATAYLNKPAKASVVYEWAVRYRGTNWYEGKTVDINAGTATGVGRFNFEPFDASLGWSGNCTDVVCTTYYSSSGQSPKFSGLPPSFGYTAPSITRSNVSSGMPNVTIWYKQNKGWGTAAGQFSWGRGGLMSGAPNADLRGLSTPMWQAGWLYYKLRITKQAPGGGFGNGRIEMWMGSTPGALVKVMEYLGDPGQRDAGNVYIDPTGTSDQLVGDVHFFGLASRRYTGGGLVDVGTIRVWSHSRQ